MRRSFPLVLALLACCAPLAAQSWQVFGIVQNTEGEALPGASVYLNDSTGVVSDDNGYYKLTAPQRPTQLIVQHLGHFSRRIPLGPELFEANSARLDLALTPQATALPTLDIVAAKVQELVQEDWASSIYDYEFAGKNLLLLLREQKRYYLRLMDERGGLLAQVELPEQPIRLHQSCTGGIHVVAGTFAQEISLDGSALDTFPRYGVRHFLKTVEPCVLKNDRYYVYRASGSMNQVLHYWYYDAYGGRHKWLDVVDSAGVQEAKHAYGAFRRNEPFTQRGAPAPTPAPTLADELEASVADDFGIPLDIRHLLHFAETGAQMAWLGSLEALRNDSAYAPLFRMGRELLIFDHVNGTLRRFDDLFRLMQELPIRYHTERGWRKELLRDAANSALYAHFDPDGAHALQKIDPATGLATQTYPLPEVLYISRKFKVRDGYLYYLGQPNPNVPNSKLYKVNIAQRNKP